MHLLIPIGYESANPESEVETCLVGFNEYSDLQLSGYQILKFYTNYSDISGYYSGIRVKNIRMQIVFNE